MIFNYFSHLFYKSFDEWRNKWINPVVNVYQPCFVAEKGLNWSLLLSKTHIQTRLALRKEVNRKDIRVIPIQRLNQ